jgi:hypothetical protein
MGMAGAYGIEGENGRIWEGGLVGRLKHGNQRQLRLLENNRSDVNMKF